MAPANTTAPAIRSFVGHGLHAAMPRTSPRRCEFSPPQYALTIRLSASASTAVTSAAIATSDHRPTIRHAPTAAKTAAAVMQPNRYRPWMNG
jgi:hypothetical protein